MTWIVDLSGISKGEKPIDSLPESSPISSRVNSIGVGGSCHIININIDKLML